MFFVLHSNQRMTGREIFITFFYSFYILKVFVEAKTFLVETNDEESSKDSNSRGQNQSMTSSYKDFYSRLLFGGIQTANMESKNSLSSKSKERNLD